MFRLSSKRALTVFALACFLGAPSAQAAPTTEIVLKIHTTGEEKDPGEKVLIIVERGGEVIGKKELGQGKIRKGEKREVTINFARPHEIKGMKVKIIKEGTHGWEFQVNVEANRHLIYESRKGLIKFRGKDFNHILLKDNEHEAWLDLRD